MSSHCLYILSPVKRPRIGTYALTDQQLKGDQAADFYGPVSPPRVACMQQCLHVVSRSIVKSRDRNLAARFPFVLRNLPHKLHCGLPLSEVAPALGVARHLRVCGGI